MQIFPMSHLMTMQHVQELDRRIVGYGALWTLAIGAALTWVIASVSTV